MKRIWGYSLLLIIGLLISQIPNFHEIDLGFNTISLKVEVLIESLIMICMSYIMIEVGLEFIIDKHNLKQYGKDFLVAMTAAGFPWIFCVFYFTYVFGMQWKYSFLLGRFAAPTSAGILFTMLAAAGLAHTWVYRKARILAIFDDLDTLIFIIPLQMFIVGWRPLLLTLLIFMLFLLWYAYKFLHRFRLPLGTYWLLLYGIFIWIISISLERFIGINVEVLLPAFAFGCSLYNPKHEEDLTTHETDVKKFDVDHMIKGLFMFLVGTSLPKLYLEGISIQLLIIHIVFITILSNLGKCFIVFFYRKEATLAERIALSIAMFPRGEVGAGILVLALGYGITSVATHVAGISLGLNLLMTVLFIITVKKLILWANNHPQKNLE